jgi:hypothetical protein
MTTLPPSCAIVMKSGNFNFLEPSEPLQACNGTAFYLHKGKGEGKVRPRTGHEGPEGKQMYSSTLPSTSALEGGWVSTPRPGRFTPGKETRYPLHRKLDGPQGLLDGCGKSRPPTGIRSSDRPASSEWLYRLSYLGP